MRVTMAETSGATALRGDRLLEWLVAQSPEERDDAVERLLGIDGGPHGPATLGHDLIGHHPSGLAAIVRALADAPVSADDVVIDLGAGLGKVALLTHLLTGARVIGVELQPALAERARHRAAALGLEAVSFVTADARDADLDEATVFYLYLPFTGAALDAVMRKVEAVARRRTIVVCALGIDLDRHPWLALRPGASFWLSLYESRCPGAAPRPIRSAAFSLALAEVVANERPAPRH